MNIFVRFHLYKKSRGIREESSQIPRLVDKSRENLHTLVIVGQGEVCETTLHVSRDSWIVLGRKPP